MTGREFLERYGLALAIVGLLALVIAILPGNAVRQTAGELTGRTDGRDPTGLDGEVTGADTTGGLAAAGGPGGSARVAGSPVEGGESEVTEVGGAAGKAVFGKGLCRDDGRQSGIGKLMPPCAELEGTNGGDTARGVTKDKVLVVRYVGQVDPGTAAILESARLRDPDNVKEVGYEGLRRYGNQHYNTYGREVVFRTLNAAGPPENDEAMKADAVRIANDIKAFAVIEGSPDAPIPKVLAEELAQRGVVCICTTSLTSRFYKANPPYIIGSGLPTADEYVTHVAEYVGKRLAGKKAVWAGDEVAPAQGYRGQTRKFGLIYIEGSRGKREPEAAHVKDLMVAELAKYGVKLSATAGYIYEGGRNAQDVSALVASMRNAGVTTVVPFVDPLYPILFTQEATRQGWFPEWLISGSGLSDTTAAARLYDQLQWRHAYGVSPLWVTWESVSKSGGHRAFRHGMPEAGPNDGGVLIDIYVAFTGTLFTGVHMAGPILTPDSFAQGMFNYPKTGGTAGTPLVYWTREHPTAIKDFTEIWYDFERSGPDERGDPGRGMIVKMNQGKRYKPGEWPNSTPKAFVKDGSEIAVSDNPPGPPEPPHEEDGHKHSGTCMSCPG